MPVDSFLDSIRAVLSLFVGMGLIVRVEHRHQQSIRVR